MARGKIVGYRPDNADVNSGSIEIEWEKIGRVVPNIGTVFYFRKRQEYMEKIIIHEQFRQLGKYDEYGNEIIKERYSLEGYKLNYSSEKTDLATTPVT